MIRILFLFFILLNSAHAIFEEDPGTSELKKTLEHLRQTYPNYLDNIYRAQLYNYFYWKRIEFYEVLNRLNAMSKLSYERALAANDIFNQINAQVTASDHLARDIEASAVDLFELSSVIEGEARRTALINNDIKKLLEWWRFRCTITSLGYPRDAFQPKSLYSVDRLDLKAPGVIWNTGITIANNYTGGVAPPGLFSEEDIIIIAVPTAIGSIGGIVGGVVGATYGSLIVLGKGAIRSGIILEEQKKIIDEITFIQDGKIVGLQASKDILIKNACELLLPEFNTESEEEKNSVESILSDNLEATEKHSSDLEKLALETIKNFDHLKHKLKKDLKIYASEKIENIRKNFIKRLNEIDDFLDKADDKLLDIQESVLFKNIQRWKENKIPAERQLIEQEFIDKWIDVLGWYPEEYLQTDLNLLESTRRFILKEIAK